MYDPVIKSLTIAHSPRSPALVRHPDPAPHGAMSFDTVWLSVGAAALAVCFHISIIPYEIDYQLKPLFGLYLASIGGLYYALIHQNLPNAGITTLVAAASFNASLIISILTYRVFLHRTRRFPGPFMARVSKFYSVFLARTLHYNKEVEKLHEKYGDFVRTGEWEFCLYRSRWKAVS
jgi:hypothetical protein